MRLIEILAGLNKLFELLLVIVVEAIFEVEDENGTIPASVAGHVDSTRTARVDCCPDRGHFLVEDVIHIKICRCA